MSSPPWRQHTTRKTQQRRCRNGDPSPALAWTRELKCDHNRNNTPQMNTSIVQQGNGAVVSYKRGRARVVRHEAVTEAARPQAQGEYRRERTHSANTTSTSTALPGRPSLQAWHASLHWRSSSLATTPGAGSAVRPTGRAMTVSQQWHRGLAPRQSSPSGLWCGDSVHASFYVGKLKHYCVLSPNVRSPAQATDLAPSV